jgi:hypothetical protein
MTVGLKRVTLEQFAQGFDQIHVHAGGQAADIVARFDRYRGPPVNALTVTGVIR